uniref:SCP domain-containing protein n=1 Tax=Strongyloides papillosus TaxID=174720 RepID=A0A0N5C4K2_STREA
MPKIYAEKLGEEYNGKLIHDPDKTYGENLAYVPISMIVDPVRLWYNEIQNYHYENPGFGMNTGHFTQLVWKNTKEMGCGIGKVNEKYPGYYIVSYLTRSKELENHAQAYAEKLGKEYNREFIDDPDKRFGKNLAYVPINMIVDSVRLWYNEIQNYHYENPGFGMNTGHFTQLVWKNTKEMGCGIGKVNEKYPGYYIVILSLNIHDQDSPYGENLAYLPSTQINDPVKLWYEEVKDYDFNNPGFGMYTGHFTQLVWKSTKEVGCGISRINQKNYGYYYYIICCKYNPPGNYEDKFNENVLPKKN